MKIHTTLLALALALAAPVTPVLAEDVPNYIEEMKRWQPKAEAGDAEAQFRLGQMYALGHGFKQNFKTAVEWYEKAAAQGNTKARVALGALYFYGTGVEKNEEKAGEWAEKAAAQNNPIAQTFLGAIAVQAKDYASAKQWLEQAVAQDYAPAMMSMGTLYAVGAGVPQDFAEAKRWYEKGAKQKKWNASSMLMLGRLYSEGDGVEKDEKQAMKWLEKACSLDTAGSEVACYTIGDNYLDGKSGLPQDHQKAFAYAMKAAKRGTVGGALILKALERKGFVFPAAEKEQALEWANKFNDEEYWKRREIEQTLESLQD